MQDSLAFSLLASIHFRLPRVPSLTHSVQTYFSWNMWRGRGRDQVDWGHGEPPTLYDTGFLFLLWLFWAFPLKGVSYQSSEPPASPGFRPGTDPSLPPPHLVASVRYSLGLDGWFMTMLACCIFYEVCCPEKDVCYIISSFRSRWCPWNPPAVAQGLSLLTKPNFCENMSTEKFQTWISKPVFAFLARTECEL